MPNDQTLRQINERRHKAAALLAQRDELIREIAELENPTFRTGDRVQLKQSLLGMTYAGTAITQDHIDTVFTISKTSGILKKTLDGITPAGQNTQWIHIGIDLLRPAS